MKPLVPKEDERSEDNSENKRKAIIGAEKETQETRTTGRGKESRRVTGETARYVAAVSWRRLCSALWLMGEGSCHMQTCSHQFCLHITAVAVATTTCRGVELRLIFGSFSQLICSSHRLTASCHMQELERVGGLSQPPPVVILNPGWLCAL